MNIYKLELYKIFSRKIIKAGIVLCLVFLLSYFWMSILGGEYVMDEGQVYRREAAVQKEKEIAESYKGPMTREKAQDIMDRFQIPGTYVSYLTDSEDGTEQQAASDKTTGQGNVNFCSLFVYFHLTSLRSGQGSEAVLLEDDGSLGLSNYYGKDTSFGYAGGFSEFSSDWFMLLIFTVQILIMIGISGVFAEEYSLKTAGVLLTTEHGKEKGILMKIAAAFTYSILLYTLFTALCLGLMALFYGTEGLSVSAVFAGIEPYLTPGMEHWTVGEYIMGQCAYGFLACLMNTAVVLLLSAVCRQPFGAVLWSGAAFGIPWLIWALFLTNMRQNVFVMIFRQFLFCLPVTLPFSWSDGIGRGIFWYVFLAGVAAAVISGSLALGYYKYKNHQTA